MLSGLIISPYLIDWVITLREGDGSDDWFKKKKQAKTDLLWCQPWDNLFTKINKIREVEKTLISSEMSERTVNSYTLYKL